MGAALGSDFAPPETQAHTAHLFVSDSGKTKEPATRKRHAANKKNKKYCVSQASESDLKQTLLGLSTGATWLHEGLQGEHVLHAHAHRHSAFEYKIILLLLKYKGIVLGHDGPRRAARRRRAQVRYL